MDLRPYLHMYTSSSELEEVGIISLSGMNIERDSSKEALFGVSRRRAVLKLSSDVSASRNNSALHCSPQQTRMCLPHHR